MSDLPTVRRSRCAPSPRRGEENEEAGSRSGRPIASPYARSIKRSMRRQICAIGGRIALGVLLSLGVLASAAGQVGEPQRTATATFAGGCFWCVEADFDKVEGVISTTSGYTGGHTANPSYEQVSHGGTGHAEAVEIVYDPAKVSYDKLLDVFWHNIDPLAKDRQFCDHGDQYRSAISITATSSGRWRKPRRRRFKS